MERFRNRVVQVTFSTPGIKAPTSEIDDDELLDTLKKIIEERTDLIRQVQDLKETVNTAQTSKREILDNSKKLKTQLTESVVSENCYFICLFFWHFIQVSGEIVYPTHAPFLLESSFQFIHLCAEYKFTLQKHHFSRMKHFKINHLKMLNAEQKMEYTILESKQKY